MRIGHNWQELDLIVPCISLSMDTMGQVDKTPMHQPLIMRVPQPRALLDFDYQYIQIHALLYITGRSIS